VTVESPLFPPSPARKLRVGEWAFLAFVLLLWPGIAWFLYPSGEESIELLAGISRGRVYLQSMAITWSVVLLLAMVLAFRRKNFIEIGFRKFTPGNLFLGVGLLVAVNIAFHVIHLFIKFSPPTTGDFVLLLLPRNAGERLLWLALSATAALGEEAIFRGFVMTRLYRLFKRWTPAVALSAIGFGLAHLYQGWAGILLTAGYGVVFSLAFIKRQSLWPCIVAHFLQDAIAALPLGYPGP
jgi:membrane protease YdiL (CAAX protease family)